MTDCCQSNTSTTPASTIDCPNCGQRCNEVPLRTILHHVEQPWLWQDSAHHYYFCDNPVCKAVYVGDDGSLLRQGDLRTRVGIKDKSDDAPLCYCFGISKSQVKSDPRLKQYVIDMTRSKRCSCETHNPSGRCCLKDFP